MFNRQEHNNYDFQKGEVLLIDKPLEWTSFDVVNKVRNLIRKQLNLKKLKVGHAGTLDPLATGLLIVCTGKFTKMLDSYQADHKEYVTTLVLGATTPSFDRETEVDQTFAIDHLTEGLVSKTLTGFLGEQEQIAPSFSAKRVDGKRAYQSARKGEEVTIKAHKIIIHEIELLEYNLPYIRLRIDCGKGTYIRSFARDFGLSLNCGAYLHELRRTKSGNFDVENAFNISEFENSIKNLQPIQN